MKAVEGKRTFSFVYAKELSPNRLLFFQFLIPRSSAPRCFLPAYVFPPPLCFFPSGPLPVGKFLLPSGRAGRGQKDPADDLDGHDPEKSADAVDAHILYRGAASGDKGLVVFVPSREGDADEPGHQHQRESPQPVHIERKGNRNGQQKIFRHMCQLPDRISDLVRIIRNLCLIQSFIQDFISNFHNLIADLIAQIARNIPILGRKAVDDVHHGKGWKKRQRFQKE